MRLTAQQDRFTRAVLASGGAIVSHVAHRANSAPPGTFAEDRRPAVTSAWERPLKIPAIGRKSKGLVELESPCGIFAKREDVADVMKAQHLGELEELALLIVIGLRQDAYGVAVQRGLERHARRRIAVGAVYAALDRLERKGYLTSEFGEATPQRGGRRKRMFAATPAGIRALRNVRRTRERLWHIVEAAEGTG
jgi:PadR family transcriptional regulator PadR